MIKAMLDAERVGQLAAILAQAEQALKTCEEELTAASQLHQDAQKTLADARTALAAALDGHLPTAPSAPLPIAPTQPPMPKGDVVRTVAAFTGNYPVANGVKQSGYVVPKVQRPGIKRLGDMTAGDKVPPPPPEHEHRGYRSKA